MTRIRVLSSAIYIGLSVLGAGLFKTQVLQVEEFRTISEKNRIRVIPLEAPRGRVFDRNHRLLVTNRPSYDVVGTMDEISPQAIPVLSGILKIPEKELRARMKEKREYRFSPAILAEDVSRETAFLVEQRKPELPGILIRTGSLRFYPYQETASHIIGYIGKISEEEYARLDHNRYGFNSFLGRAGLEKIYDESLRGWRGGRQVEVNARGDLVRVLSEKIPEPGQDIQISIDLEFQKRIMGVIKNENASVAVLDLKTDQLVALASNPAFDPNAFVVPSRDAERAHYLKDPNSPLIDRGAGSAYPPGSIFKLVTAIAGLETGKITPNTRFFCNGGFRLNPHARTFHCWNKQGHGSLNLYEALERSCNVYFYNVASRLSPDDIAKYARELGFGEKIALDVTRTTAGLVPDSLWKQKKLRAKWFQGETLTLAIGQGYLLTSPLQVLRLVSIIAKNGLRVEPRIVLDDNPLPSKDHVAIRPANLEVVKRGMLQVVQSPYGTGQLARVDFTKFAAKTGTAQAPPNKAHAWMAGFFPHRNPQVAFVVFVEHGGSGGIAGAHVVKEMLKIWKDLYGIPMA